jgi:tetratricopeptide (TPR) repeat protein
MDAKTAETPAFIRFLAWFEVNRKRVLIGAVVVLVVGLAVGLFIYSQSQREVRASEALSEVRAVSAPSGAPAPGAADAFKKVAREHRGTQAGGRALIMAGTSLYIQSQYDEAQKLFEQFAKEFPASPFVPEALYGVASSLDAQKKSNEAIAKFEELRRRYAKSSVMDQTKLALGRLYEEQGKYAQALDLYDELVKGNQFSGIASEAGLRMEDLLSQHPELKKTNAPPIMSAATPTPGRPNTNLLMRPATNRQQVITITNLPRSTNMNRPLMTMTNRLGSTGGAPIKLNVTNK